MVIIRRTSECCWNSSPWKQSLASCYLSSIWKFIFQNLSFVPVPGFTLFFGTNVLQVCVVYLINFLTFQFICLHVGIRTLICLKQWSHFGRSMKEMGGVTPGTSAWYCTLHIHSNGY